uniref:Uncharacterized protein n=1 Tax=Octopus bimaculoides TaxID=37653 RepID=A0A0L8H1I8_OCTBM
MLWSQRQTDTSKEVSRKETLFNLILLFQNDSMRCGGSRNRMIFTFSHPQIKKKLFIHDFLMAFIYILISNKSHNNFSKLILHERNV